MRNPFSNLLTLLINFFFNFTETNIHTLYSHNAAHHHNMAALPPLHVRQHLFHQPCQAKDICVKELLHGSDTLALQRPNHADPCIVHCNSRAFYVIICLWRNPKLTSDVFMEECKREMPDQEHPPVCLAGC